VLRRPGAPTLRLTRHLLRHSGAGRQLRATVRLVDVLRPARCRFRVNAAAWAACPGGTADDVTIARPVPSRHGTVLLALRVSGADGRALTRTFRVR
jgi:hypothetical protein